ncbi:MAG: hypothetical protein AAF747_09840 [Planctomycetota bacterium]
MSSTSRSLAVIPIVHTEADLGKLAEQFRRIEGDEVWNDKQRAIATFWERIVEWTESQTTSDTPLFLFQDGLPAVDQAEQIVCDLASRQSINHVVLASLMDHGGTLIGTEDPDLLLREYEIAKAAAEALTNGQAPDPRDQQRSATLLDRRDRFIAERIDQSLPPNASGVLFIGMLHNVEQHLPSDITVNHPLGRPTIDGNTAHPSQAQAG